MTPEEHESLLKKAFDAYLSVRSQPGCIPTGTGTPQRSCQGSTTAARTQAHQVRADLDRENGVQG